MSGETNMAEMSVALLHGLRDEHMISLQNSIDSLSLENFVANEHLNGFKAETEKIDQTIQNLREASIANGVRIQESSKELESLKKTFEFFLSVQRETKPSRSDGFYSFQHQFQELQETFPQRLADYTQYKKKFNEAHSTPQKQILMKKLNRAKAEMEAAKNGYNNEIENEKKLDEELIQKEMECQLEVEELKKEITEAEKSISLLKKASSAQNELFKEIEELLRHPDMTINDSDSSAASSVNQIAPSAPVFEMMSNGLDLDTLFKDPNDFPYLLSPNASKKAQKPSSGKQHNSSKGSKTTSKRALIQPVQNNEQSNPRKKRRMKPLMASLITADLTSKTSTSGLPIHQKKSTKAQALGAPSKSQDRTVILSSSSIVCEHHEDVQPASPGAPRPNSNDQQKLPTSVDKIVPKSSSKAVTAVKAGNLHRASSDDKQVENMENISIPETPEEHVEDDCEAPIDGDANANQKESGGVASNEELFVEETIEGFHQDPDSRCASPSMEMFDENRSSNGDFANAGDFNNSIEDPNGFNISFGDDVIDTFNFDVQGSGKVSDFFSMNDNDESAKDDNLMF